MHAHLAFCFQQAFTVLRVGDVFLNMLCVRESLEPKLKLSRNLFPCLVL